MTQLYFLCFPIWGSIGFTWLLQEAQQKGEGKLSIQQRTYYLIFSLMLICVTAWKMFITHNTPKLPLNLYTGGMLACILVCAMTDLQNKWVYDIVVIIGFLFGLLEGSWWNAGICEVKEWLFFSIVQVFFFRKMYGRGDVAIFLLCGFMNLLAHGGVLQDLLFMLLVFGVLGMHQMCLGNINAKGNLKKKVALVPYIGILSIFFYI